MHNVDYFVTPRERFRIVMMSGSVPCRHLGVVSGRW